MNTKELPGSYGFSVFVLTPAYVYATINITSSGSFSIIDARLADWTTAFTVTKIIGLF